MGSLRFWDSFVITGPTSVFVFFWASTIERNQMAKCYGLRISKHNHKRSQSLISFRNLHGNILLNFIIKIFLKVVRFLGVFLACVLIVLWDFIKLVEIVYGLKLLWLRQFSRFL